MSLICDLRRRFGTSITGHKQICGSRAPWGYGSVTGKAAAISRFNLWAVPVPKPIKHATWPIFYRSRNAELSTCREVKVYLTRTRYAFARILQDDGGRPAPTR
jgi:hypothetical protein